MRQWCKTDPASAQPRPAERFELPCEPGGDDDPAPFRGWHESSWDLRRGLAVAELPALEEAVWRLVGGDDLAAA